MTTRDFAFPGTRPRYAADRVVDIQHVALALDVDLDKRAIVGTARLRTVAIAPRVTAIELDAVELAIEKVVVNGKAAAFRHDGRKLYVTVAPAATTGATVELAIDYRATPRRGLYFIAPDPGYPTKPIQVWTQGQDEDSRY